MRDLETLTTSLSTVNRNLEGFVETYGHTANLVKGYGRASD